MHLQKAKARVIVFCAPSGSGKTTVVHRVLKEFPNFSFSISATTREKRKNETHGKDYYFFDAHTFKEKIKKGEFLEWEEVYSERFYGTLKSEIEGLLNAGKNVVFDVDVKGGQSIKKHFGDNCIAFFIKPPSLAELRRRLVARGTDSAEEIERRLKKASGELLYGNQFDITVVNHDLEKAVNRVFKIIRARCAK